MLQKQQEGLRVSSCSPKLSGDHWSLRSHPLLSCSAHIYVQVSILPCHFHFNSEPKGKLQLHITRRIIPCWCLHIYKNVESLALMVLQCKLTEISKQQGRRALLQLSELQSQSSKDLAKPELSLPGSFYEKFPQKF